VLTRSFPLVLGFCARADQRLRDGMAKVSGAV